MTNITAAADAYAAAATAFRSLRFAATLAADERAQGRASTPDENCIAYLDKGFQKLKRAIELADSCKLDAADAIVAMSAYALSDAATAVHNAKYMLTEAAYLDVVLAAREAHETCTKAETIFREGNDD